MRDDLLAAYRVNVQLTLKTFTPGQLRSARRGHDEWQRSPLLDTEAKARHQVWVEEIDILTTGRDQ
jgi:hypothetical protein